MKEVKCDFLKINESDLNQNHVIRIGSVRDGGYFVTKRIVENSDFLISGGISYNVAFEKDNRFAYVFIFFAEPCL